MPQIRPIHLLKYIPVLAAAASGAYAQKPTLANSAPFALSARELLDEAAGGPSSVATDTIILLDHDAFVFDADGRKTETTHLVYRVVTAKGVEGAASIERDWEPWHQKRPVVRARVIASDGAVHELDPKTVTEAPARADQGNTFSDARVVRCPLPAVAAGSVVEEEIVTGETAPWFSAGVATRVPMTGPVPIRLMRVTVEYPEKLALQYKTYLLPDADTTKQTNGGTVTLRFEASSPEPFQDMQPMLPFDVPRWPHVIFSTGGSWNAVARAYNAIVEKQIEGAPVADLVKQSAAGKTGRRDIASALLRTIHAQVRYTGVEFGEAAIVPAKPADVLGRKYGDCKDKAALLVSMLRAAGIPAYVALLSNGLDMDVDPAFPGLGLFNHAIVYSPGAQASDDLWIDATAEYLDFGAVPASDQGRLALIVREDATELKRIPESPSSSDHVSETREFFLPDFGKARVVATIEAGGESGESYREGFGSADTDQVRKGLTAYMQRNYLSESTVRIDHSAGSDFSKPFHLRLEVADSNLGSVSEAEAGVVIPLVSLLERMPGYFLQEEPKPAPDSKPKPKRTEDFVLPESFVTEWHYRIELPAGFQIKKVPENKKLELGPALLTSEYKEDKNVVTATLKFDTVKRRYTANEAAQFRKAALEFAKQPVALLYFETVGQNRLESGRIAEAIVWSESMVKQFPKRALYHVQASRAYLAAGCGDQARREAEIATGIDQHNLIVWRNLGFIRLHDSIGRQFARGFDSAGAETAFRKALAIDPKDQETLQYITQLLEYDENGRRYESLDRLNQVIESIRAMGDDGANLTIFLLYDLAYAGRFTELRSELDKLEPSPEHSMLRIVATASLDGSAAAIVEWDKERRDTTARNAALEGAGETLMAMRRYAPAADLFAAIRGSQDAAQSLARANAARSVQALFDPHKIDTESPGGLVSGYIAAVYSLDTSVDLVAFFSREAVAGDSLAALKTGIDLFRQGARRDSIRERTSPRVMADLVAAGMKTTADRNRDDGFRVRVAGLGPQKTTFYVVTEDGKLKLLGTKDGAGVARRILADVDAGKLAEARQWLDWVREEIPLGGGDDPLNGAAFPRFWTKGSQAPAPAIRLAAYALLSLARDSAKEALPKLHDAIAAAPDDNAKTADELAYIRAALMIDSGADALAPALSLANRYPDSSQARSLLRAAYLRQDDWRNFESLAKKRLAEDDSDIDTARQYANALGERGRFAEAEALFEKIGASANANDSDSNQLGWYALLAGHATPARIEQLQRAAASNGNNHYLLHTLASLYAEAGKTAEAREVVLNMMDTQGLEEPNSECWYVFGRLAEQFGVREAALADYRRVAKPETPKISKSATRSIAQERIAGLK